MCWLPAVDIQGQGYCRPGRVEGALGPWRTSHWTIPLVERMGVSPNP